MKGIILAGGQGTRLYPSTLVVSKQLLSIYDKPMIYYPLSILLLIGIKEILIISTKNDMNNYKRLLGNGKKIGVKISYGVQKKPRGIVDALIIGKKFIAKDSVCLILGDNIFYGNELPKILQEAKKENKGATIFGYRVNNPEEFGVVQLDKNDNIISIEEKPKNPKSKYIVPGLYFYNNSVVNIAKKINASKRKELEITTPNNEYLKKEDFKIELLNQNVYWFDTGTPNSMLKASNFVKNIQLSHRVYIACIEEIAWRQGFINNTQLKKIGIELKCTDYGKYILSILEGDK